MRKLSDEQIQEIERLIGICKEYQGEYRPGHHGSGSWATTYSNEFIDAAAKLYELYSKTDSYHPAYLMSQAFIKAGIRSCRGKEMTFVKVSYLVDEHLRDKVRS